MKHKFFFITLLTFASFAVFAQNEIETSDTKFRITGYGLNQPGLLDDVKHLGLTKITHLNIAFVNPDSAGKLHPPDNIKKSSKTGAQEACTGIAVNSRRLAT